MTKIKAYRIYSLQQHLWHLVIRYDGNEEVIKQELDRLWEDHCSKIDKLPRSCPTLVVMQKSIEESIWLEKYRAM